MEHPGCHCAQLTVELSLLTLPRSWSVAKALMMLCLMKLPPPSVAQYRDSWCWAAGFQQGHYHPAGRAGSLTVVPLLKRSHSASLCLTASYSALKGEPAFEQNMWQQPGLMKQRGDDPADNIYPGSFFFLVIWILFLVPAELAGR